ncbi:MAG: glutamate--tRNA ligase [Gammaproteobacteria bacterium]|nr:glutamate--tRNA ligase [Gammaproteobacteria bacterium]
MSVKTRFAPSPTGYIHLGNARTALFNALKARAGGCFLLRIEDTDEERSRMEFVHSLQEDLTWLGLDWQEGPIVGGDQEPYFQSQRAEIYNAYYDKLVEMDAAYPCFCSETDLNLERKFQRSAGKPPRYSGKCAHLSAEQREQALKKNPNPTLRFRVPKDVQIEFEDLVRGKQSFAANDIGDFIIRRGDKTAAFFFSNAIDDALMKVTHVLRGEDHLANTPRQQLILQALGLPQATYAHISMIVGHDGSPLSKRHGSRSIRELRAHGYLPEAVVNYLARLGHYYEDDTFMSVDDLGIKFSLERLGKSAAKYDPHQLLHWQHQALAAADEAKIWDWMGLEVRDLVGEERRAEFIDLIRANVSFPEHALHWAKVIYEDPLNLSDDMREAVVDAGRQFFEQALVALDLHPADFKAFSDEIKKHTGAKGKALFTPLRAAMTGELGGPEMSKLMVILGPERIAQRLRACLM